MYVNKDNIEWFIIQILKREIAASNLLHHFFLSHLIFYLANGYF